MTRNSVVADLGDPVVEQPVARGELLAAEGEADAGARPRVRAQPRHHGDQVHVGVQLPVVEQLLDLPLLLVLFVLPENERDSIRALSTGVAQGVELWDSPRPLSHECELWRAKIFLHPHSFDQLLACVCNPVLFSLCAFVCVHTFVICSCVIFGSKIKEMNSKAKRFWGTQGHLLRQMTTTAKMTSTTTTVAKTATLLEIAANFFHTVLKSMTFGAMNILADTEAKDVLQSHCRLCTVLLLDT